MTWKATNNPNDACCWSAHVEDVDYDKAIADVWDYKTAVLLSATPELLEACKAALNQTTGWQELAQAAIAKATQESEK